MARYKKSEDYYLKKDLSIKISKDVFLTLPAGTGIDYVRSDEWSVFFKVRNALFGIEFKNNVVEDNINTFAEEAERSAK